MRWGFTLWGQPPSWNDSYRIAKRERMLADGRQQEYRTLVKKDRVKKYQDDAIMVIKTTKPSRWKPEGMIRVIWTVYLARDVDCDNLQKAIHDAIEVATGINDRRFLPCFQWKYLGVQDREARVEIIIDDDLSPPSPATGT